MLFLPATLSDKVTPFWLGSENSYAKFDPFDVTFVTAFFDIGRGDWEGNINGEEISGWLKRPSHHYMYFFSKLAPIRNQIIVFTEEKFCQAILNLRTAAGLANLTNIFICQNLFDQNGIYLNEINTIKSKMNETFHRFVEHPALPEYWNSRYVFLNILKSIFVTTAIEIKLKINNQIAWIDFGYCREEYNFELSLPWRFNCNGRMNLFFVKNPNESYRAIFDIIRTNDVYIQGALALGPKNSWNDFSERIDKAFASMLSLDLVDDDQSVELMAYRSAPHLFILHALGPNWLSALKTHANYGCTI